MHKLGDVEQYGNNRSTNKKGEPVPVKLSLFRYINESENFLKVGGNIFPRSLSAHSDYYIQAVSP